MCDYCEGKRAFQVEYFGEGIKTMSVMLGALLPGHRKENVAHIKDGILFADTSSGEYAELGFEINFCPMCGEKIERENKHE
jgi:hypothetical protein